MPKKKVEVENVEQLHELRDAIAQRGGEEVSDSFAVGVAVGVALRGLGGDADAAIYSTSRLAAIMRSRTFESTVASLRDVLAVFDPEFTVEADPDSFNIEVRRTGSNDVVIIGEEAPEGARGMN